jgi:hypothetical protein
VAGVAAGTTVLSVIIAGPAIISLAAIGEWQSRRLRRGQQETARAETEMSEAEDAASAVYEHSKDMRRVLRDLRFALVRRLPSFTALFEACNDFQSGKFPLRVVTRPGRMVESVAVCSPP